MLKACVIAEDGPAILARILAGYGSKMKQMGSKIKHMGCKIKDEESKLNKVGPKSNTRGLK